MHREVAKECLFLSEKEQITFPEVVARLHQAGIESYQANLLAGNTIFYQGNESFIVPLNIQAGPKVAHGFTADKVVQAIRAIQAGKIKYQEFLKEIMDAGVIYYAVYITGRKAVYVGRNGEQHVENFPSKP